MAEEFINRLNGLEKKIDGLGETLMRMITILGNVTDLKSDLNIVKQELTETIKTIPQPPAPTPGVTKADLVEVIGTIPKAEGGGGGGLSAEEVSQIVKAELAGVLEQVLISVSTLQGDLNGKIEALSATVSAMPAPVAAPAAAPAPAPVAGSPAAAAAGSSGVSPDKGMKIADQLDIILKSLKMGCKAGPVLDTMNDAKAEIMKIVPSDPVMIKIDKWVGVVNTYSLRHELQAKDILKLKKDLKAEIPKYRPA
ncbi:MAG: hypothetical protein ACW98Y_13385 [Candidatus Thorarchaeota archaeon]|jgi:hypothetical protein